MKKIWAPMMLAASVASAENRPNVIVILTDDHGYADLSCVGTESDVKTPNIDRLAAEGARFTDGYITAPQCTPSRAGLLTGRDQNRFGLVCNGQGYLPLNELTLADRLKSTGYATGMVGKWHLEISGKNKGFIDAHAPDDEPFKERFKRIDKKILDRYQPFSRGFQEAFSGRIKEYLATYDLKGNHFETAQNIMIDMDDRVDIQTDAALQFIDDYHEKPFFLYLAYYAPHVPLASSAKYLSRFPGKMPERRRYALAMISAIDDGVGCIRERLEKYGIDKDTLIFFLGDNGAPLHLNMVDLPVSVPGGAWDGSKNTPLNGEKGMLAEGGIRVPFVVWWEKGIPGGQVIDTPVISLDIVPTACAAAGLKRPEKLDGENLLPLLADGRPLPERNFYWRFWNQTAVRRGDWKFLKMGNQQSFLFNLKSDKEETFNRILEHPEIAHSLEAAADKWAADLKPEGVPDETGNNQEAFFYNHFFNVPLPDRYISAKNPFEHE